MNKNNTTNDISKTIRLEKWPNALQYCMGGATSLKPCMLISSPPLPSPPLPYPRGLGRGGEGSPAGPSFLHYFPSLPVPGGGVPIPPTPPLHFPHLPLPVPLGVPPLNQLGVWGSAISSPSVVWGEAPADKRFGTYLGQKEQLGWQQFLCIS